MGKIRGMKGNKLDLHDELEYLPAKEAAKIKKGLKKAAKKINPNKHIYFNEEWNNKNQ